MRKYDRFVEGFRRFAEQRMTPEEALAKANDSIRKRVLAREENFLSFVEKGVFEYIHSPYLKLLEPKQIRFNDLKTWVGKDGIEGALRTLENEGVYFTVDEFKGKVPVMRNALSSGAKKGCS